MNAVVAEPEQLSVSHDIARQIIEECFLARLTPMIWGPPGIGKSELIYQIAKIFRLKVIDLRLAQCDPTDLNGFPYFQNGRATYVPMDVFPLEGDKVPDGYEGWIIFLDELSSAPRAIQAPSYKLILDRKVGNNSLHKQCVIAAAGNRLEDNAIAEEMSTALKSRMVHLNLKLQNEVWLDWAFEKGIDHRITDYIKFKPANLYNFRPDAPDHTYASGRTWEFTHRLIHKKDVSNTNLYLPMLAGTISEGVAREFLSHVKLYNDPSIPTQAQIVSDPLLAPLPIRPDLLFALTGLLGTYVSTQTIDPIMKYVDRMPLEYQVVTVKEMMQRDKSVCALRPIHDWLRKNPAVIARK